ncbi:hypothetical protein FACS1894125_5580 [Actinomycetota bacterium]|nr:hypothetical protein FACS1894125_5580 [Actinomycetota bacterium]
MAPPLEKVLKYASAGFEAVMDEEYTKHNTARTSIIAQMKRSFVLLFTFVSTIDSRVKIMARKAKT